MELYGDESGHLRSLLEGNDEIFVLAVVAGDRECCMRCPKRAVRNVTDIEEARWSDLTKTQRRRLVECLVECEPELSFGYVAIEQSDLHDLEGHYLLYEDALKYDWDLCVIADSYTSLVGELVRTEPAVFTFDRLISKKMSERVTEVMNQTISSLEIRHDDSRKTTGIQTADCFAGAVREDWLRGAGWLDNFEDVTDVTDSALATVEKRLLDAETGP